MEASKQNKTVQNTLTFSIKDFYNHEQLDENIEIDEDKKAENKELAEQELDSI